MSASSPQLRKYLGVWPLALLGVGDMMGTGIYGLIGKAAGQMGNALWLAFLGSMAAALCTGLSYASLGSRYPRAAGSAYITHRAFGIPLLAYVVGLTTMASGMTSIAAATKAFAGYFHVLVPGASLTLLGWAFLIALMLVNLVGIHVSSGLNVVCTIIEVLGLAIVIFVGFRFWGSVNYLETPTVNGVAVPLDLSLILSGAVLTFYSFVGFEDLLNLSEEAKDPARTFPRALILALVIATIIYLAVGITAVSVMSYRELADSTSPLVDVVVRAMPSFPPVVFTAISLFAVLNTALMNHLMSSRLIYGMGRDGLLPSKLGTVHPKRQTPHVAIFVVTALIFLLTLLGDISVMAKATSFLLLSVFFNVNFALFTLQGRSDEPPAFEVPRFVPILGMVFCGLVLSHAKAQEALVAGGIVLVIILLYFVVRPKDVSRA